VQDAAEEGSVVQVVLGETSRLDGAESRVVDLAEFLRRVIGNQFQFFDAAKSLAQDL